jgi:hypothetical protein
MKLPGHDALFARLLEAAHLFIADFGDSSVMVPIALAIAPRHGCRRAVARRNGLAIVVWNGGLCRVLRESRLCRLGAFFKDE